MGLLDRMFRDIYEQKAGRIHVSPGGWAFEPPQSLLRKTIKRAPGVHPGGKPHIRQDADGKDMTFIYQRTVNCPNREMCQDRFPKTLRKKDDPATARWYVPDSICRKCQFREKASRRYRFPRCLYRASKEPAKDALADTFGFLEDAAKETAKIIGR